MAPLVPGMLVEITRGTGAPPELEGRKAQLLEFDNVSQTWEAVTFEGADVSIAATSVRELNADDVTWDFVLGPKSDPDIVGEELADTLSCKGYATIRLFVSPEDTAELLASARQIEEAGMLSRFPSEFERGYLGVDSIAKVVQLNPSAPDIPSFVGESPLAVIDDNFTSVSCMLRPHAEATLGFDVYSRTDLLLRMPVAEGDDRYPPQDIRHGEVERHFHLMHRRRLTVMQFIGPASGTVRLLPRRPGATELTLQAEPCTLLFVLESHFDYSYSPSGESIAAQTFYLSQPIAYALGDIEGDVELLGTLGGGPQPPPGGDQITIDAMYCRYGGGSDGREQMWAAVGKASTDGLTEIPFNRWDNSLYYDPEQQYGGLYTKHGCFGVEGVELFDCKFFDISPAEAKCMDPVQRQVMEVSYMALMEAGYDKRSLQRESKNIGHFVGIDKDDWMNMVSAGSIDMSGAHGAAGAANSITSNRFSYSMNLKGASMTIDTACSSSLVCSHVSKMHLRMKDYDPMPASIVNGINLMLYPGPYVGCCAANMLSHKGRCFTFDVAADGYARGELCGALCFKHKQYDDRSFACLAGSQVNQDGRSASLTAPNGPAQERCIKAVLREAGLTPADLDCFECHGTGTALGDPIEVGSFRKVMSTVKRTEPLLVTSSKSNIGHGEGGAGLAGFFKCCLQVAHSEATSNVHLRSLNPHLDIEGFPCLVLSESVPMRQDASYCGVSSFGFGGTNAHAEAWGRNILNSRGAARSKDLLSAFQRHLAKAPPAQITTNGDNFRDWETTGLRPDGQPGASYRITLDESGVAVWELDDSTDDNSMGDEFFFRGTHSDWQVEAMARHATIEGLWTATLRIGSSGEEQFQIAADGDEELIFHPGVARCTFKATPIAGPGPAATDLAWLVRGKPGAEFRIEFFRSGKSRAILWLPSSAF